MKKNFIAAVSFLVAAFNLYLSTDTESLSDNMLLDVEALADNESSGGCKWKIIDCGGIFSDSYEACLVNGDGYSCSCGEITRDC